MNIPLQDLTKLKLCETIQALSKTIIESLVRFVGHCYIIEKEIVNNVLLKFAEDTGCNTTELDGLMMGRELWGGVSKL